jgi:salicylate hydroxylase
MQVIKTNEYFSPSICLKIKKYGLTLQQARRALRALGIVENDEDSDSVDDNDGNNNNRSSGSGKILQHHAVTSTKHVVHTPDGSICGEWGLRKWTGVDCEANNKNINETYTSNNQENETKNRIKPRSSRAKNKKRRQNLHVPRQTLRYVLYEALKEASADNNDDSPDISWGHKLVDIQPVFGDCSNNMCTADNTNSSKIESETKQQSSTSPLYLLQPKVELSFQVIDENGNDKGVVISQADLVVGCDGIFSSVREKFLRVDDENDHNGKDDNNYDDNDSDNDNDGVPLLTEPIATKAKGIVKQITPLRYLHCIVLLGICSLGDLFKQESSNLTRQQQMQKQIQLSALLDGETVFQTADGTTRIYLMPYSKKNNEYMWQLSFPIPDEDIALGLSRRGPKALKDEALRRCQSWHVPIPEILKATPIELVSGYPVYDRDLLTAEILSTSRRRGIIPRPLTFRNTEGKEQSTTTETTSASTSSSSSTFLPITLLGDAAHPMSPFKGQGANQALIDALSLARVLYRVHCREGRSLEDSLELYEKEMIDRSSTKVRASSEAAKFLHTEIAIQKGDVTRGAAFSSSSVTKNK